MKEKYPWAIIGAGPAAVTAIAKLIDQKVKASDILWISDHFNLGDLANKWPEVPANTSVGIFQQYLKATAFFDYGHLPDTLAIKQLPQDSFCQLNVIADALQLISKRLQNMLTCIQGQALALNEDNGLWQIRMKDSVNKIHAQKVILATGSMPLKQQHIIERLTLQDALTPSTLKQLHLKGKKIAIFGGSHSAILAVMNTMNAGAKVYNFYKHPLRYAQVMPQGILYDNIGLKGDVAQWAKANLHGQNENCQRVYYKDACADQLLQQCDYVIDAIGFQARDIPINGMKTPHCPHSGIIAHNVFGCGIAYPEKVTGIVGNQEWNVGLKKFGLFLDKVLPVWLNT